MGRGAIERMRAEYERAFKSPHVWVSLIVCFLTLSGYSAAYWIGCNLMDEVMEYRQSALQLSLGGIFFGGFMLLLPFCSALAHSTSQVDDIRTGMMRWEVLRSGLQKYVGVKVSAAMSAAALSTALAFALHAIFWNCIAIPCDPATYPMHTLYFAEDCIFRYMYDVCYGLPVYIEMTATIAFTASVWAVIGLATSVWIPDKLLTVTIPSFLYYLWSADVVAYFTGISMPEPGALFNDALTISKAVITVATYMCMLCIGVVVYYMGCRKRCCNA